MADSGEVKSERHFNIDDGINRDEEFARFDQQEKEVKSKREEEKKEKVKQKAAAADVESEKQYKNRDTVLLWGPILITGPLVPAFLALFTIAIGTVVLQWHFIDINDNSPCLSVQAYVAGQVILSYMFLATYMSLLIGPQCCARACGTTTLLFVYWIVFGVLFLGLNGFGLYTTYSNDWCFTERATTVRTDDTVALWMTAAIFVFLFWLAFLVLCCYVCYLCYWRAQLKKKATKVLSGLTMGNKKGIDYSGYKSLKHEANEANDDEEQEEEEEKKDNVGNNKGQIKEEEEVTAGQSNVHNYNNEQDVATTASTTSNSQQQKADQLVHETEDTTAPDWQPDYNRGFYDDNGNWLLYTAEEIAAYETEQATGTNNATEM